MACVLERISARQAEADEETVGVDVGERAQLAEILAASIIPDRELELDASVVLRHVFSWGEHSRLVQGGEGLIQPGHNERGLADAVVAHESQLYVVLLLYLIDWRFCLYHFVIITLKI